MCRMLGGVESILRAASTVLVVDWPSREVPNTLAAAGYSVVVRGGPEPDNYSAYELRAGEVVTRRLSRAPERADVVYCHRPLAELAGIVALARELGAATVWRQSGLDAAGARDPKGCWTPEDESRSAREMVEGAGLVFVDDVYIVDAVRGLQAPA